MWYAQPCCALSVQALADESEAVRETALRAGQRLISSYSSTAMSVLLPELEHGLLDDNWRIRHASVQLLGDLLYKIAGVTGKMSTESGGGGGGDDDSFGTETAARTIMHELGVQRRNRLLAALYVCRSDTSAVVRQASGHVWKVVVSNTPRTVRELLADLFALLLAGLASASDQRQAIAARCLGELVRKMGERVLVDIMPVLERGLQSPLADQRQGVCVALAEILSSTSREMVLLYADSVMPCVRAALVDPLPAVRRAAATTFDALYTSVGSKALDDVISPLVTMLVRFINSTS